ncbi:phage tail tape measure protein [Gabonibacter chumensis]|uniref:phage tail tape measure protein n=1 Tax=Gabonibacter chumensis TaxID=2972474 RepID=UPI002572BAE1|nr:phage tail tape measure protein [Gabonibacter chumensis]MCR9011958.1 phage tail tape measure protein [Gabonibacter chumensis]
MAATYEYIISLQDKVSGTMKRVAGTSEVTITRLNSLANKAKTLNETTSDLGNNIFNLKQKIDLLKQEKELIDPSNLKLIKQYNREISGLEKQVSRLDNAGKSGKLKKYLNDVGGMLKGIIAPVLGAAAFTFTGKEAMNFSEGMAKVNITAQLDEKGLNGLKSKLKQIAKENKADITVVPNGFEKIISQTGEVESSLQILNASLKGSKAGFVDLDTVTGALAQTLSIVGTKNATAQEILDTFFAAKRVGAGEFKDFAQYMPGLIAGADALGVNYKNVAGIFAYMTGKGQDAARASVLMSNMFASMSKTDITKNLAKAGVKIFDAQGKMRGIVSIFRDLGGVMAGMNDEQKTTFLEKIGIVDKEAKSAFAIMGADIEKLSTAMDATANATGETVAALEFSKNPVQKATELWNQFKAIGLQVGEIVLPVICVGIDLLGTILNRIGAIINGIISFFSGWIGYLQEGNPLAWGLTSALGALTIALAAYELWTARAILITKAKVLWDGIVAVATGGWTTMQWALNAALYACPLAWIVALVIGLIAAIVACCSKVQGWGKQWDVIVNFMKNIWELFVETFKFQWNTLANGFMLGLDTIKLGWYKFKEAVGLGNSNENQKMIQKINGDMENRKQAIIDGAKRVKELTEKTKNSLTWELSLQKQDKDTKPGKEGTFSPSIPGKQPAINFDNLIGKLNGKTGKGKTIDLNKINTDYKGSTSYAAITERLSPVKLQGIKTDNKMNKATELSKAATGKTLVDNTNYEEKENLLKSINLNVSSISNAMASTLSGITKIAVSVASIALLCGTFTKTENSKLAPEFPSISGSFSREEKFHETRNSRNIYFDKYCDQVVINIQNTDQQGINEIEEKIQQTLTSIFDNYEV